MGERKGVNKYYPPDFDPSKGSLNTWLGSHPLRDRARKLHKGILVIRFEMPYNIWCGGCNSHIGMGVRYNAEKSKVGNYYTTPIYKFRMKCHLCDNHFEIQTDPKNHDYVILEGARRKEQRWDPRENEQIVPEDKATQKKMATDPMYKLEHGSDDKDRGKTTQMSVAQIEDMRESWIDDYMLNKMARNKFREEKKEIAAVKAADKALLDKCSLDIELVPEEEEDQRLAELIKYSVTKSFDEKQQEKRKAIEKRPLFSTPTASSTLNPMPEGSLSRRAEIKRKLGLHLTSPKVGFTLTSSAIKGLVKSVHRPVKSSTSLDSLASTVPKSGTLKQSQPIAVKGRGENDVQEQDVKVRDAGEVCVDEKSLLALDATSDDRHNRLGGGGGGTDLLVSMDRVDHPGKDTSSKLESSIPADVDSLSLNPSSNFSSSAAYEVSNDELCDENEKTGLAALMASYSDSDTNSSDTVEN